MKKMLMGSAAAIAMFFTLGTPARSADVIPEPAPEMDWSGLYLGVHAGYGWANMDGCFECPSDSELDAGELDLDGFVGGVHAGYNFQWDSIVLGIEGDVSFGDMHDEEDAPSSSDHQVGDVDLLASLRARLGVAFDDFLIYGTGGIAFPDAVWEGHDVEGDDDDFDVNFNDIGGVVGGGVEFKAAEHVSVRAEGLYYFFGESESVSDEPDANPGDEIELDDAFVVRGGITFHFNP